MTDKDGGPAFPQTPAVTFLRPGSEGMSLRDYFAGQVLGMASHDLTDPEHVARRCYVVADAMLVERERQR